MNRLERLDLQLKLILIEKLDADIERIQMEDQSRDTLTYTRNGK
jgi:hypothetical protein